MSAIAASLSFDGSPVAGSRCERILRGLAPYGSGKPSSWTAGSVAVGCDLRASLPEDAFDRQPATSRDERYALVADIRLDNRLELAELLGLTQTAAPSLSDCAILLEAICRWGMDALDHLTGVFAFVLWDTRLRRLHLARDPVGERPLFFYQGSDFVAVASMPRGLHALSEVPYEVNEERVAQVMVPIMGPTDETFFRGLHSVLPGNVVTFTEVGGRSHSRYWRPEEIAPCHQTREQSAGALQEAFDRAVTAQLRGRGDVISQLSGGMDSTLVTATAARLMAGSNRRLIAVTAAPVARATEDRQWGRVPDETEFAELTAALYPEMEHLILRPPIHISPLDEFMPDEAILGRPQGHLCNLTWFDSIYQVAHERGIPIVLHGVPGNVTVSHPGLDTPAALARCGHLWHAAREIQALQRRGFLSRRGAVRAAVNALFPALASRINRSRSLRSLRPGWMGPVHPDRVRQYDLSRRFEELVRSPRAEGLDKRIAVLETCQELGQFNKATLACWGVDQRSPMADRRVLEVCFSIPAEHYLEDGQTCAMHLRAFGDRLPKALYSARPRGLQGSDWWDRLRPGRGRVRAEIAEMQRSALCLHLLDLPRLSALVDAWPTVERLQQAETIDYRSRLLRAIAMGRFLRMVERGRPVIL
ncbi:asparagine synthetase B [Terriglobus sp. 2YAB30_2]|uniref:asparagine synthetase B family protein n=1 Tax=unclassified Terriglobus TaxID=2628988 RepID=UPI003F97FB60